MVLALLGCKIWGCLMIRPQKMDLSDVRPSDKSKICRRGETGAARRARGGRSAAGEKTLYCEPTLCAVSTRVESLTFIVIDWKRPFMKLSGKKSPKNCSMGVDG